MATRGTIGERWVRWNVAAVVVAFCWATQLGHAIDLRSVTLAWDASTGPDVAGYRLYYYPVGQRAASQVVDVGDVTTASIDELIPGWTYEFHATCYNTAGLESDPSNTVEYTVPESPPGNQAPVAESLELWVPHNTTVEFTLVGSDPDDDPLSFVVVTGPEHGMLEGQAPHLSYTPATDYAGPDAFMFQVHDGLLVSEVATVSIVVLPPDVPPDPAPPEIIGQPEAEVHTTAGDTVVLTVEATGEELAYQWTKDGVEIEGAIEHTLTLAEVTEADAGVYAVKVSNAGGTVTSGDVVLTVSVVSLPDPVLAQPVIADGMITVTWEGGGELETAEEMGGPWSGSGNSSGLHREAVGGSNRYYRIARSE